MELAKEFTARYKKEYDFYEQSARLVSQLLEQALRNAGIRAIVTFRAKTPSRLEEKIRQRAARKQYTNIDKIYRYIADLAGVRVALYFPGEREQVGKIVRQLFVLAEDPKEFPAPQKSATYKKRFAGYGATHYRVHLRESSLNEAQKRYADALVEIQVASVLMHAWAEVEHDLVYKPAQGLLSEDEYAILDELNGLVMAGEIALERLQSAAENRILSIKRRFENHFDLAAYLLSKATTLGEKQRPDSVLGRVDVLFSLLRKLNFATPEKLQTYLQRLTGNFEERPVADQIIDQLLIEDGKRYRTYEAIRKTAEIGVSDFPEGVSKTAANSMGMFITK